MSFVVEEQLLPIAGAARHARNLVTEVCSRWHLAALIGPASLVVDELVSNAVEHAGTMITLRIRLRSRSLHVAVADGSPEAPRLRPPPPVTPARRGRGLMLVDALSIRWGWLPAPYGKVVWAMLSVES